MSEFFVRRPIVAIVIAILMTLIGGVCILALPIAQYPQIAPPEIQVQTHYTGADALTIEQAVASPIEQQRSGVDNMNYMLSTPLICCSIGAATACSIVSASAPV